MLQVPLDPLALILDFTTYHRDPLTQARDSCHYDLVCKRFHRCLNERLRPELLCSRLYPTLGARCVRAMRLPSHEVFSFLMLAGALTPSMHRATDDYDRAKALVQKRDEDAVGIGGVVAIVTFPFGGVLVGPYVMACAPFAAAPPIAGFIAGTFICFGVGYGVGQVVNIFYSGHRERRELGPESPQRLIERADYPTPNFNPYEQEIQAMIRLNVRKLVASKHFLFRRDAYIARILIHCMREVHKSKTLTNEQKSKGRAILEGLWGEIRYERLPPDLE